MTEEVNDRLIAHIHARGVAGKATYGKPLLAFDGRNTLVDAMEEALDTAVYLQKKIMENETIADLLERAAKHMLDYEGLATCPIVIEARDMAAKLRADCERSVPVSPKVEEGEDEHFPWHFTSHGTICACGEAMDSNENCLRRNGPTYQGPADRLAQMEDGS